jgi:hypothetical protein
LRPVRSGIAFECRSKVAIERGNKWAACYNWIDRCVEENLNMTEARWVYM